MEKLAFFIFIRHTVYGILEPISKFHSGSQRTRFLAVTLRFGLEISRYSSPSTSRFAIKITSLGSKANFEIGSNSFVSCKSDPTNSFLKSLFSIKGFNRRASPAPVLCSLGSTTLTTGRSLFSAPRGGVLNPLLRLRRELVKKLKHFFTLPLACRNNYFQPKRALIRFFNHNT